LLLCKQCKDHMSKAGDINTMQTDVDFQYTSSILYTIPNRDNTLCFYLQQCILLLPAGQQPNDFNRLTIVTENLMKAQAVCKRCNVELSPQRIDWSSMSAICNFGNHWTL